MDNNTQAIPAAQAASLFKSFNDLKEDTFLLAPFVGEVVAVDLVPGEVTRNGEKIATNSWRFTVRSHNSVIHTEDGLRRQFISVSDKPRSVYGIFLSMWNAAVQAATNNPNYQITDPTDFVGKKLTFGEVAGTSESATGAREGGDEKVWGRLGPKREFWPRRAVLLPLGAPETGWESRIPGDLAVKQAEASAAAKLRRESRDAGSSGLTGPAPTLIGQTFAQPTTVAIVDNSGGDATATVVDALDGIQASDVITMLAENPGLKAALAPDVVKGLYSGTVVKQLTDAGKLVNSDGLLKAA